MKTDDLIDMLGNNVEPVKGGRVRNALLAALGVGALVAICLMATIFDESLGRPSEAHFGYRVLALVFTLGLAASGAAFLVQAARPGTSGRWPLILIGLLFSGFVAAGVVAVLLTPEGTRASNVLASDWLACLVCIPLLAAIPFAALITALRSGAPTNLTRSGAIAGLVAGALGAMAFALHQPPDSTVHIALLHGGPIVLCALVGAIVGQHLLRW